MIIDFDKEYSIQEIIDFGFEKVSTAHSCYDFYKSGNRLYRVGITTYNKPIKIDFVSFFRIGYTVASFILKKNSIKFIKPSTWVEIPMSLNKMILEELKYKIDRYKILL